MDDAGIIELFFARDEGAVSRCREKYGAYLRAVARNVSGSESDAEECEADAYAAAWRRIPPERPRSLRAWLAKAARYAALDILERGAARKRGGGEAEAVLDELAECVPAPGSVGDRLDAEELARAVDAFLKTLGERERVIFVQRCFECESTAAIARRCSVSEQAVRSALHRTRLKLRAYLEKEELL